MSGKHESCHITNLCASVITPPHRKSLRRGYFGLINQSSRQFANQRNCCINKGKKMCSSLHKRSLANSDFNSCFNEMEVLLAHTVNLNTLALFTHWVHLQAAFCPYWTALTTSVRTSNFTPPSYSETCFHLKRYAVVLLFLSF